MERFYKLQRWQKRNVNFVKQQLPAVVKQQQEEISRTHVPSLFAVYVFVLIDEWDSPVTCGDWSLHPYCLNMPEYLSSKETADASTDSLAPISVGRFPPHNEFFTTSMTSLMQLGEREREGRPLDNVLQ